MSDTQLEAAKSSESVHAYPTRSVEDLRLQAAALREAGMTLIEIMIVVVIMALVATGVGIAVVPQLQKAKMRQAESGVETVRTAVQLYIATNNAECATMDQLIEDKAIDKSKATTDPWDHAYRIECEGTDITVISAGPDGEFDTEDDIK
ncbi:MAG: type II secretion system protein GspG [Myxococcales bacterium]